MLSHSLQRFGHLNANLQRNIEVVGVLQKFTTLADVKDKPSATEVNLENARPHEQIPGPTAYQFLRAVLPGGLYYKKSAADMVKGMNQKYGPLFIMPGLFGNRDAIVSLNPADYSIIFRNEGQWPNRRSLDTMVYFREVYRREYFQGVEGIVSTSGEKWYKMRSAVNPVLMQPKNARLYLNTMLEVNDEFLERIREIRNPETLEMPENFEDEIMRLALESVSAVALNTHLGLLNKNRETPESKELLYCIRKQFELAFELDIMPSVWKIVKTPNFKELMRTLDFLTDTCDKYISEAMTQFEKDPQGKLTSEVGKEKSVLEKLARIDRRIAVVMAFDMMLAGVDTTTSTLTGILLCLAKNPEKQVKLFIEIKQALTNKDSQLTLESLKNLPYLRACIKEGIRMYPLLPGTMRRLSHDVVLSGFRVNKDSDIVIAANLLLDNDAHVPHSKQFLPERWLRNKENLDIQITNPFLYLPFGFGPRSCVGKRIVELELEINVARLVRNFNIEFNYSVENAFKSSLINMPAIPLKFKFEERLQ